MLWYIVSELPKYENDAVIVSAMREACHHNLYALANSSAMNGIGPNTTIKVHPLPLVTTLLTAAIVLWVLFILMLIFWIKGKKAWKKSPEYLDLKTLKNISKQ
jgi:beta-glucosidase